MLVRPFDDDQESLGLNKQRKKGLIFEFYNNYYLNKIN